MKETNNTLFMRAATAAQRGEYAGLINAITVCPKVLEITNNGWYLLHHAVVALNPNLEIIEFLLKNMSAPIINKQNNDGFTALCLAIKLRHKEVVEIFLQKEAYFEHPLFKACEDQEKETEEFLLNCDLNNINVINSDHNTPLFLAVEQGDPELVKFLIEKKAIVNLGNSSNDTPLYMQQLRTIIRKLYECFSTNFNFFTIPKIL